MVHQENRVGTLLTASCAVFLLPKNWFVQVVFTGEPNLKKIRHKKDKIGKSKRKEENALVQQKADTITGYVADGFFIRLRGNLLFFLALPRKVNRIIAEN